MANKILIVSVFILLIASIFGLGIFLLNCCQSSSIDQDSLSIDFQSNPSTITNSAYIRTYGWKYGAHPYKVTITIPSERYTYFKNLTHSIEDIPKSISDPYANNLTQQISESIKKQSEKYGCSEKEMLMAAVSFVQSIQYASDAASTGEDEYVKYPIETLVDENGDCEDTAILCALILKHMGYGTALLLLPNHMAIGISSDNLDFDGAVFPYNGSNYYYLETTEKLWKIGRMPSEYNLSEAQIIPLY